MLGRRCYQAWLLLIYTLIASAHMEMSQPLPIRSRLDPETPGELRDYNMIAPLLRDGSDFPCKNYHSSPGLRPTTTYTAGNSYHMSIVGGATHHGGSCQLSLSFDDGASFKAIKSMIGGCASTATEYSFNVPSFAPPGPALFAWTWFNLVGNREMYMNCAEIVIVNDSLDRSAGNDSTSLKSLPDIYVANVGPKGACTTTENRPIIFPEGGPDVIYGNGLNADSTSGQGPCGESIKSSPSMHDTSTSSADLSSEPPRSTTLSTAYRRKSTVKTTSENATSGGSISDDSTTSETLSHLYSTQPSSEIISTQSLFPTNLATSTADMANTLVSTEPASPSTIFYNPATTSDFPSSSDPGLTFIHDFKPTDIQAVVSPTLTVTPPSLAPHKIIPSPLNFTNPSTASTTTCQAGVIFCSSAYTFSLCSGRETGYIPMGRVALGTICINGRIRRARSSFNKHRTNSTKKSIDTDNSDDASDESKDCEPGKDILRCVPDQQGRPGKAFQMCDDHVWTDMGRVAQGTTCRNGGIVADDSYPYSPAPSSTTITSSSLYSSPTFTSSIIWA